MTTKKEILRRKGDCDVLIEEKGEKIGIEFLEILEQPTAISEEDVKTIVNQAVTHYKISELNIAIQITVKYYGAPDWVVAARAETAFRSFLNLKKKAGSNLKFALPKLQIAPENSEKLRLRRSMMYIPGSSPYMLGKACGSKSDSIIFDLEDSVATNQKEKARILIRHASQNLKFTGQEILVRINEFPMGEKDLEELDLRYIHGILIPKCQSPKTIEKLEKLMEQNLNTYSTNLNESNVFIHPLIETALGVEYAFPICECSERIATIAMGLEDYCADCGMERSKDDQESQWALSRIRNAAVATRVQNVSSVFSKIHDLEQLEKIAIRDKKLGYQGKRAIHPKQIPVINRVFLPSQEEIEWATKVVKAYEESQKKGLGAISIDGQMIDVPVVKRAMRVVKLAEEVQK
ncbi:lyase beta subunit [Anaeramoeba flamelloides]|uniref:Lyase beta subunit n=1 Tax=Anaeramoeba flamelloides TaxID=1746091 RepID=A0AAV8A9J2_9EUKA|nr:putative lyase beta subunit [Anaeramoeba flamelloides]KAJ6245850.1 lyase beta subunit [Anaeramoeba flamelloides]|eukprot:Anaeramoba_flamelloidesa328849_379.p1 GENE.a328849_379~~a328849_379.p1  ORF type:complete len:406 (-),score=78.76 a328849_379:131-1348(-)